MNQTPVVATASPLFTIRPVGRSAARPVARSVAHPAVITVEELQEMKARLAELEALNRPIASSAGRTREKSIHGRNPALRKAVHNAVQDAKSLGVEFSVQYSMKHPLRNLDVYNCILNLAIREMKTRSGLPEHQELSKSIINAIDAKIRNQFDTLVNAFKQQGLNTEQIEQRAAMYRKSRRLQRKHHARLSAFVASCGLLGQDVASNEECEAVLKMGYMSEDEDTEDEEVGKQFRTAIPSWRSQKLTNFYYLLDKANKKDS